MSWINELEDFRQRMIKEENHFECLKCKLWNMSAKDNGFSGGMCGECYDKNFVSLNLQYEHREK